MNKEFLVIGLGRFGGSVCKELYELGHQVLAVDIDEMKVEEFSKFSSQAIVADASNENVLQSIGVENFDYVVVAIGDNLQASILCTLLLKELGVKNVLAKAQDENHKKLLAKIGADRIIQPELDMGIRIANQIRSDKLEDYIELSDEYSISELNVSEKLSGRSISELDIRANYNCTILAIKRNGDMNIAPAPKDQLWAGDIILVIGSNEDILIFEEKGL
ncbi:TrkA family potassium uptake protein [Jeotgalibaca sp. MA1X17-3]|uniref:potassium channel family protein n=1 Tax=Jeotgalibaca sp. MA1X17-3 TaxID=2908211 RepID=UPI001F27F6BF|nr:TrkA family potassium uptake protein [Jeotgalibaca sp. MA1X17-3]UJF16333.1 TrkA family potassium uptake protein [Jeotgalibaca sp. MA1X17-3]